MPLGGSAAVLGLPAPGTITSTGRGSGCVMASLAARTIAAPPGEVLRTTAWGPDRTRRLVLSTELVGASRRDAGVLSMAVSLPRLFEATPSASAVASSAALVDMATDSMVAGARTEVVATGSGLPGARPLGNLRVRINGIVNGHTGTTEALEAAGWVATAAPLWRSDDGAHFGLIHVWPLAAAVPDTALLAGPRRLRRHGAAHRGRGRAHLPAAVR